MNLKTFKAACAALWGPQYKSEGARQLGVSLSTMNRYDAGTSPINGDIEAKLVKLLHGRRAAISLLLDKLEVTS